MLAGEVVDEFSPVGVVLADVVVVDRLLNELSGLDERVDGGRCGVGRLEERLPVDLADEAPVDFDETQPDLRAGPEMGANTEEVLLEMGYDWDDIVRLKDSGAIL